MKRAAIIAQCVAVALIAAPATAQEISPDIIKATTGEWLFARRDGKPGCRIILSAEKTIGGYALTAPANCATRLPKIAEAAAWRFDGKGGLALADATRKTIVTVTERQEGSFWEGESGEARDLVMIKAPKGVEALPMAKALFGKWIMRRPGGPAICEATLLDKPPPGGEESFALTLSPTCDAAVKKLKLASWRIETLDLQLYGTDGEGLAFTPRADGNFSKSARAGGRPLEFVRASR
ncbi:AprI/Inh family metalloprotease inhibitor [Terrarubrum flagellatum]|uniref:AprI/Inh family metalloprotease inhibitor n=1 Tax=Terrirubrum flagellatum TaxID=2895980 RepID=UPI00314532BB